MPATVAAERLSGTSPALRMQTLLPDSTNVSLTSILARMRWCLILSNTTVPPRSTAVRSTLSAEVIIRGVCALLNCQPLCAARIPHECCSFVSKAWALIPDEEDEELLERAKANR